MVTKLTPDEFRDLHDADVDDVVLVDTRPDDSFESWRIPGAQQFRFGPRDELDGRLEEFREVVGDADRVVTVCAKGVSSSNLASDVEAETDDYELLVLDGGMEGWSRVYDRVPVDVGGRATVLQVQRRATGCLGYVVGDPEAGEAIVVDPTADLAAFERAASQADLAIEGVIDTHVHADHVSGGPELAAEHDVPYYLGERAAERDLEREFAALERNEVLEVGDVDLKALSTPGHTSESIGVLVDDRALLTADTLHVASTGRTELEFGDSEGERGARMLYETLHRTVLAEPDSVTVLPGHVTVEDDGTFEHGEPGEPISTTVGTARTEIDVLELAEDEFVEQLADPGEKPANYERIVEINRGVEDVEAGERIELEGGPNNCSA